MNAVNALETITYYHNDALGSPVAATDEAGNVLWREAYKPYGSRIRKEDNGTNDTWFTGKQEDKATGLSYFGARWYDPVLGRFTGIDPVGFKEGNIHSFNRYAYVNNNPYKYVDPDGREVRNPNNYKVDSQTLKWLNKLDANTQGVDYDIGGGIRTEKRNKEVGGSKSSKHLDANGGTAVDVNPKISKLANGLDLDGIARKAADIGFTGVITYKKKNGTSNSEDGRLHLDRRKGSKFHTDKRKINGKSKYIKSDFGRGKKVK